MRPERKQKQFLVIFSAVIANIVTVTNAGFEFRVSSTAGTELTTIVAAKLLQWVFYWIRLKTPTLIYW